MFSMLNELFLIRHAAPDRTTGLPYTVMPGPPLTLRGEEEAVQAGHWLRDRGIERLLSSPFTRTVATATVIGQLIGMTPTVIEALREVAPGEQHSEVRARIADLINQCPNLRQQGSTFLFTSPFHHCPPFYSLILPASPLNPMPPN